ncbi:hypothetical protein BOSEA31B_10431 [Hyphomicrobiales bacterium]|nr:hypothetical protein BOSEA31B_10431 [Hyphomicrobiales bacterium]CAH1702113.1 hypothetical protein BOSEA1005_21812 [Hyphomicrobiales bacterium]CAI0346270.1 hypothetical protein BO1005MUT1_490082 [Hyphomicrobiales bacterium]
MGERLTARQRGELYSLIQRPGLWTGCGPGRRDADLEFYLAKGLVRWLGEDKGYEITPAGRRAVLGRGASNDAR